MDSKTKNRLADSLENVSTKNLAKLLTSGIVGEEYNTVLSVYMDRDDRNPISDTRRRHNRFTWMKRDKTAPKTVTKSELEHYNIHKLRDIIKPKNKYKYSKDIRTRAKQLVDKRSNKLRNIILS